MIIERILGLFLSHLKTIYYRTTVKPTDDFDKNVIYKMIWDRREILKTYNDKVKSLEHVKDLIPNVKYPRRYYETDSIEKVDWSSLPEQFACKASHGSGGIILIHKKAPSGNSLPMNSKKFGWRRLEIQPKDFDSKLASKIYQHLMKSTYAQGFNRRKPEWGYWFPEPKLIIEEFLSLKGELPPRIECNVIDGEVRIVIANDLTFSKLNTYEITRYVSYTPSRPTSFKTFAQELQVSEESIEELVKNSIIISGDCDYLRVDWLLADGGFFFNEITPYSGGGNLRREDDLEYVFLSNMWRPKRADYK